MNFLRIKHRPVTDSEFESDVEYLLKQYPNLRKMSGRVHGFTRDPATCNRFLRNLVRESVKFHRDGCGRTAAWLVEMFMEYIDCHEVESGQECGK